MDLEAAKLFSGNVGRYTMIAAIGCLLLAALILLTVPLTPNTNHKGNVALNPPVSKVLTSTRFD